MRKYYYFFIFGSVFSLILFSLLTLIKPGAFNLQKISFYIMFIGPVGFLFFPVKWMVYKETSRTISENLFKEIVKEEKWRFIVICFAWITFEIVFIANFLGEISSLAKYALYALALWFGKISIKYTFFEENIIKKTRILPKI